MSPGARAAPEARPSSAEPSVGMRKAQCFGTRAPSTPGQPDRADPPGSSSLAAISMLGIGISSVRSWLPWKVVSDSPSNATPCLAPILFLMKAIGTSMNAVSCSVTSQVGMPGDAGCSVKPVKVASPRIPGSVVGRPEGDRAGFGVQDLSRTYSRTLLRRTEVNRTRAGNLKAPAARVPTPQPARGNGCRVHRREDLQTRSIAKHPGIGCVAPPPDTAATPK